MASWLGITSVVAAAFSGRYSFGFCGDLVARFTHQDHAASRAIVWFSTKRPMAVIETLVHWSCAIAGICTLVGMISFFSYNNQYSESLMELGLPVFFISFCMGACVAFFRGLLESIGENMKISLVFLAALYLMPFLFGPDARHPVPWPFLPTVNDMLVELHTGINIYAFSSFWQSILVSTFILVAISAVPALLTMLGAVPFITGLFAVSALKWLGIKCEKYCPTQPLTALSLLIFVVTGIAAACLV